VPADLPQELRQQLKAIQSPDPRVRRAACERLAQMGEKATPAVSFLIGMLGEEPVWRLVASRARIQTPAISAAAALREITKGAGARHLDQALKHESWVVRANLVWVLGGNTSPAAVKLLARAAEDPNAQVRLLAVSGLRRCDDKAAISAMVAALKDPEAPVRARAAYGLTAVKTRSNLEKARVIKALATRVHDEESSVRASVAVAMGRIGDSNAITALMELLKDKDYQVRYAAADALGQIKDRRTTVALVTALAAEPDTGDNAQVAMVRALGLLEDPRATLALTARLKSAQMYVRRDAATALGQIRDRRAVPALIEALADDHRDVRESAARALGAIGDLRGLDPLIAALKEGKSPAAALALGKLNDPRAIEPLAQVLLEEDDALARLQPVVADALGQIRHPAVVPQLVKAGLNSKLPASYAARLTLGTLTGRSFRFDKAGLERWWTAHQAEFATDHPRNH
jgi:HEAT repeat protein